MTDIERRITDRSYRSPPYARAAVARSKAPPRLRKHWLALIDQWEASDETAFVVGGLPEPSSERSATAAPLDEASTPLEAAPAVELLDVSATGCLTLNLNDRVRVHFTLFGLTLLQQARGLLGYSPEKLERVVKDGGVFECCLWELCAILGSTKPATLLGEDPIERSELTVLYRKLASAQRQIGAVPASNGAPARS